MTKKKYIKNEGSLCWKCVKAQGGFNCPWVDEKPSGSVTIEGWKAEPKVITKCNNMGQFTTYIVKKCPLFEKG